MQGKHSRTPPGIGGNMQKIPVGLHIGPKTYTIDI